MLEGFFHFCQVLKFEFFFFFLEERRELRFIKGPFLSLTFFVVNNCNVLGFVIDFSQQQQLELKKNTL